MAVSIPKNDPLLKVAAPSRFVSWVLVTPLPPPICTAKAAPLLTVAKPEEGTAADCENSNMPLETVMPLP